MRWCLNRSILTVAVFGFSAVAVGANDDPGAQWVSAYAWIQTGDQLAEASLWPLAIGSYIEADRKIKALAKAHPDYEPDVVAYRLEKLQSDIKSAQQQLTTGEHDLMMNYLDFIESFELGLEQRFANDFEESLTTLTTARSLLDELIEKKPDEFEAAVQTQHELLDDSIDWLYSQVSFKRMSERVVVTSDTYDWGTTRYIKESDMPSSEEPVEPFGALFPNVPTPPIEASETVQETMEVAAQESVEDSGEAEPNDKGGGLPRFRMNSKSSVIGASAGDEN